MLPRVAIRPMFVGESRRVDFDFNPELQSGELILSQTVTVRVLSGEDPAPQLLKAGSASQSGGVVQQRFLPTIEGNLYEIKCAAATDDSQVLTLTGILAVPMLTTDPGVDQVTASAPVAEYDSGVLTAALSPTELLSAADNANGGLYRINAYVTNLIVRAWGATINPAVVFTDKFSGALTTLGAGSYTGTTTDWLGTINSGVYLIQAAEGTQILIRSFISGSGPTLPNYRITATVDRLQ
ncbi:MAG TPA: hypothetical protein VF077_08850 [Nitrospiraceae bacterium]